MAQVQHPIHRNCACHPRFSNTNTHLSDEREMWIQTEFNGETVFMLSLSPSVSVSPLHGIRSGSGGTTFCSNRTDAANSVSVLFGALKRSVGLCTQSEKISLCSPKREKEKAKTTFASATEHTFHCDYRSVAFCHFTARVPFALATNNLIYLVRFFHCLSILCAYKHNIHANCFYFENKKQSLIYFDCFSCI